MGRRLQARRRDTESRALLGLTAAYLGVFIAVIAVLSFTAYQGIAANYRSILAPALDSPEGRAGLAAALRPALYAILSIDGALVLAVGGASFALARLALRPMVRAREREERFSAEVAHELRTPLGAIASIAQAARGGATGETRDALETIARRALEGGRLVTDLLTLARASDPSALDAEPVDLAPIARAVVDESDGARTANGPRLALAAQSAIVLGDERRLHQLMRNLVDNALAHARTLATLRIAVRDGDAIVAIDDDGPGVEPALVPRLFERFAHGSASRGSGLGLAICRWTARAHGGDITYLGGATFEVVLPRIGGEAAARRIARDTFR